jgi:endonuclease III
VTGSPNPLTDTIPALRHHYGPPAPLPTSDPFELILLENVAYLASTERRTAAFELLKQTVGTTPEAILSAPRAALERVTAHGILKSRFANKLRDCAQMAIEFGDRFDTALQGPVESAKRMLRKFPGIGEPGADKILLFTGRQACLAPESNGLRVLARIGCIVEDKSYARTYRAGNAVAAQQLPEKIPVLREAHLLLHQHGSELCKRTAPLCARCPLISGCAFAKARGLER